MIQVVIADDIQILRQGLKAILSQDKDIQVTGLASNGKEAFGRCQEQLPDVVLMDMRMPEYGCAIVLLKELKGFRRVSVARGKRERVAIAVPKSSLRYWDETTGGFVTVPASLYDVFVGSSSADIRLQTAIAL